MRLLHILASWTALSVPISVATGFFLAAGHGEQRPAPVRAAIGPHTAASAS